jgi:hypothetical protein
MLRELLQALDALPEKRLASHNLINADGEFCTLGALGHARGVDLTKIDAEDREAVAKAFGIAEALAAEIMFENDEMCDDFGHFEYVEICGPMRWWERHQRTLSVVNPRAAESRWFRMRNWVVANIKTEAA